MPGRATRRIVIGLGNPGRGDDGAGRAAAELLRGILLQSVAISEETGEATALLSRLEAADEAYLIDACRSGAAPGTVHRFDAAASPLPQVLSAASTHGLGLAAAIELARALGTLPRVCVVYAIEGLAFETGARLSSPVRAALPVVARRLVTEIADREEGNSTTALGSD